MSTASPPVTDARLRLNGHVAVVPSSASADVTGQMMTLSPQMAADLLKRKVPNRPISKSRVRKMIADMRSGAWIFNGEPLIVSADLELLDGQHRCMAIAEAGVTLPMMVVVGVRPDADVVMSIDRGKSKVGSDMLSMSGLTSNLPLLASTARWLYRYERQAMRQQASELRNEQLPSYVQSRPGLQVALPWGRAIRDVLSAAPAAMLFHLMNQRAPATAKHYYDDLSCGVGLTKEQPAHVVRERLLKDKSPRTHMGIVKRAALVALGWVAIRSERPLSSIVVWKGVDDPTVPFPQVV